MPAPSLRARIEAVADALLSPSSTPADFAAAFAEVERILAAVAVEPNDPLLDAFLRSQDSCCLNLTGILLEWLGRTLAREETTLAAEDREQVWAERARCLRLVQGLLLVHRSSQRFFARRASFEYLLAILDRTRTSAPSPSPSFSTSQPFPSPVLFPPSPMASPNLGQAGAAPGPTGTAATPLALAALDVLLCALVDRPRNMRVFEDAGGVTSIVKVLKDKAVAQPVRIKVIELLYFYLLPEAPKRCNSSPALNSTFSTASSSASTTLDSRVFADSSSLPALFAAAADFVPQTPARSRTRPSAARDTSVPVSPSVRSGHSSASSRESSPTRTPRILRHKRSQSLTSLKTLAPPPDAPTNPFSRSVAATPRQPLATTYRLEAYPRRPRPPHSRHSLSASGDDSDSTPRAAPLSRQERPPPPSTAPAPSPRASHRRSQSLLGSGLPPPPPATPRARVRGVRGSSDAEEGEMLPPPVPPAGRPSHARARSSVGAGVGVGVERRTSVRAAGRSASGETSAGRTGTSSSAGSGSTGSAASSYTSLSSSAASGKSRERHTRTEDEKRELLRRVMPNVDALEERFKAMGLGLG